MWQFWLTDLKASWCHYAFYRYGNWSKEKSSGLLMSYSRLMVQLQMVPSPLSFSIVPYPPGHISFHHWQQPCTGQEYELDDKTGLFHSNSFDSLFILGQVYWCVGEKGNDIFDYVDPCTPLPQPSCIKCFCWNSSSSSWLPYLLISKQAIIYNMVNCKCGLYEEASRFQPMVASG